MSTLLDDERRMVPRWRLAREAIAAGEFTSRQVLPLRGPVADPRNELELLVREWKLERRYGIAADLVAAASLFQAERLPADVLEAALFVVASGKQARHDAITRLAERIINPSDARWSIGPNEIERSAAGAIRTIRRRLHVYPHNPLLWVDLARHHATLGHALAAERAMRAALGLAPEHRFVLRAFTRLGINVRDEDEGELAYEAWQTLRSSRLVKVDPWVAAADIACGMIFERSPRSVKNVRSLIERSGENNLGRSELAASLGALEVHSGAKKLGRKLFELALINPTENALAQVTWTDRQLRTTWLERGAVIKSTRAHEAGVWRQMQSAEWEKALTNAEAWQSEEPFSSRPIRTGTFITSVTLGDFSKAASLARAGLLTHPNDETLRNNLAFALASLGDWKSAEAELGRLRPDKVGEDALTAVTATYGLVAFRSGDAETGRRFYELAVQSARRRREKENEVLAHLYLAREELIGRSEKASAALERAKHLVERYDRPEFREVLKQIREINKSTR